MKNYLNYFTEVDKEKKLDNIMKAVIRECQKDFDRFKKIPEDKYREYVQLTSQAQSIWEKAKNNNDFSLFQPYLEKIVNFNIEFAELWGYEDNKYDTLLDYPELKGIFKNELSNLTLDDFYKSINLVEPSLIRIEADELTYNLHIMIRYEIEKALINQDISVSELPDIWNDKVEEYLGVRPKNDQEGVLQDIHWSNGLIGYFPSYTLGNIYAAQFYYKIKEEINDFDELVENGQLKVINNWFTENIHKHGKLLNPGQIIKKVTGEPSNSKYLNKYLKDKYFKVYDI